MYTDLPYFCKDCGVDNFCPVCNELCRNRCIFCSNCEKFLHAKCTKLTKGQVQNRGNNYICHLCIKDNLPINAVDTTLPSKNQTAGIDYRNILQNNSASDLSVSCTLCVECDTECLTCDLCPNMQRVCDLCLSCKYYEVESMNKVIWI